MIQVAFSVEVCPPCNDQGWEVHDIRNSAIQKWRSHANTWGKEFWVNPGLLLAVVSLESNGKVDTGTSYVGLTQIGQDMLNTYNKAKNTSYTLDDLKGKGKLVKTEDEAGSLSIKIFAEFISQLLFTLDGTSDLYGDERLIKDAATNWNGSLNCGSGEVIYFYPFRAENGGTTTRRATRTEFTCYGQNIYNLMNYASSWCGTSPWYSNDLPSVTFSTTYRKTVGKNR